MVALVVVADSGVSADDRGCVVNSSGVDLGGDQARGVAECSRVEYRRKLAQHALTLHLVHPLHDLGLGNPDACP